MDVNNLTTKNLVIFPDYKIIKIEIEHANFLASIYFITYVQ
jgi:hypothetical protein